MKFIQFIDLFYTNDAKIVINMCPVMIFKA